MEANDIAWAVDAGIRSGFADIIPQLAEVINGTKDKERIDTLMNELGRFGKALGEERAKLDKNDELFCELGISHDKLVDKLDDKTKRLQKRVKDIERLTTKLAEANAIIDIIQYTLEDNTVVGVKISRIADTIANLREAE